MSTHCRIYVRIDKEDFGKTLTADITKLPNPLVENNYPCLPIKVHSHPIDDVLFLGIYCHFDGYPKGVGAELRNKFNSYEKALNLVLLGSVSYIINEIKSYHNWRNEDVDIRLIQGNVAPPAVEDYTYIFHKGEWHCIENYLNLFVD